MDSKDLIDFSAMNKPGIWFTAEQEKLIKELYELGKIAEAQKIILENIANEYRNNIRRIN